MTDKQAGNKRPGRESADEEKAILFIAPGFGLGRVPFAPGAAALFLVGVILCAIWISQEAEILIGGKDPGAVGIDEMAGFCVTMTLLIGFIAFRCFDILKPFPIRWFEKTFSGGTGIVLDDLMAGALAAFLLKAIYFMV